MSVNESRSMNYELDAGRCDGSVQKIARNRGGQVDAGTHNARRTLHRDFYNLQSRDELDGNKVEFAHGDEALP